MISDRIKYIYIKSIEQAKVGRKSHFNFDYHNSALTMFNELPLYKKLAKAMAYAIKNQDVWVSDYDNIGGRIFYNNEEFVNVYCEDLDFVSIPFKKLKNEIPYFNELVENQLISCLSNGKDLWCNGHISWNYKEILKIGVSGLKEKYTNLVITTSDVKSKEFYEGVIILLDSLLEFNDKHIIEYKKIGLNNLAERMSRVPRYKAESFIEAVQSFYIQHIVVMRENPFGGNSPGRLDYYLWPYLENDLNKGIITLKEAKEIIDELFIRFEERLYHYETWYESIVVGGTNKEGKSSVNPLTYIMIESIIDLDILHPSVYIRVPKDYNDELLSLCSRYLLKGKNRAQILNDESIINALIEKGVKKEDAFEYACGGCMEIGIQGKSSDLLYGGWQNLPKILELKITGGYCLNKNRKLEFFNSKSILEYHSFEEFYRDFINECKKYIFYSLYQLDVYADYSIDHRPSYLLSSMIDNCLENGRSINKSAPYKFLGSTPMGLPDIVDSLYAIKYAIFDYKICSKEELLKALKCNYNGFEKLKNKLSLIPKYGMNDNSVDSFACKVFNDVSNIYHEYRNDYKVGNPVVLTFIHSAAASSILGATSSGRLKHGIISQGITPNSISMSKGITAAINSCKFVPFNRFSGGASTMWDLDKTWANDSIVKTLLKVFFSNNGQIFQGNIISSEELVDALENPNKYSNLFVRVGGFSARFINLSKDIQYEIINRYKHNR